MAEVNDGYFGEEMEGKILSFQKSQPPGTVSGGVGRRWKGGSEEEEEETGENKQVFARSFAANVHTKWWER